MVVAQYGAPEGEWEPFELCRGSVPGKEGPKRSSEAEDISIFRDNWAQETGKGWGGRGMGRQGPPCGVWRTPGGCSSLP